MLSLVNKIVSTMQLKKDILLLTLCVSLDSQRMLPLKVATNQWRLQAMHTLEVHVRCSLNVFCLCKDGIVLVRVDNQQFQGNIRCMIFDFQGISIFLGFILT